MRRFILNKWLLTIPVILIVGSILNYYRLQAAPTPTNWDYYREIDGNTKHSIGGKVFIPPKVDVPKNVSRLNGEIPYVGTHYVDFKRAWFEEFNPARPAGYITWKGKTVGYFWFSDKPVGGYHWHFHHNLCYLGAFTPTTRLNALQCWSKGGYFLPDFADRWMLHFWLVPTEGSINDMYNTSLI